jgi:YD repeat-containing protein
MKIKYFSTIVFSFFCSIVISQNQDGNSFNSYITDHYSNIVPPTPNGASFAKYGNTSVNTSSGLPSISIPIYTIEEDGVQVPISINYDASGIKVDDISSTVGMKWTLNAGGAVIRTVNDLDDFSDPIQNSYGWIRGSGQNLSLFDQYLNEIDADPNDYKGVVFQYNMRNRITRDDNFPDDFSYHFLNFSGDFKFKPNGNLIQSMDNGLGIVGNNGGFDIWDSYGNSYQFDNYELNTFKTRTINYTTGTFSDTDRTYNYVGWFLTKVLTKNRKNINFQYDNYGGYQYSISPASERMVTAKYCDECVLYPYGCEGDGSTSYDHNIFKGTQVFYDTSTKLVSKIYSDNVEVNFNYEEGPIVKPDGSTINISGWDKRIQKIIIKDKLEGRQKEFDFKYDVFDGDPRLKLTEIQEKGFNGNKKPPYRFFYNTGDLPNLSSTSKDYKGYYNGKTNQSLLPFTATSLVSYSDPYVQNKLGDRYFDEDYLKAGVLNRIVYPTGGETEFTYEANAFGENFLEPLLEQKHENIDSNPDDYEETLEPNFHVFSKVIEIDNDMLGKIKFGVTPGSDCPFCYDDPNIDVPYIFLYKYDGDINDNDDGIDYNLKEEPEIVSGSFQDGSGDLSTVNQGGIYLLQLKLSNKSYDKYFNTGNIPPRMFVNLNWFQKKHDLNGNIVFQKNYFGGLRIKEISDYDVDNKEYNHTKYNYLNAYLDQITYSTSNFMQQLGGQKIFSSDVIPIYNIAYITGYAYTKIEIENLVGSSMKGKTIEYYDTDFHFNRVVGGNLLKKIDFDNQENILKISDNKYSTENIDGFSFHKPTLMDNEYDETVICGYPPHGHNKPTAGYGPYPPQPSYSELKKTLDSTMTTQFLKLGNNLAPVTTVKSYEYNDNLLITKETTDARYTADINTNGDITGYTISDPDGKVIETDYRYVDDPTINPPLTTLPVGLPVSKEVFNGATKILGQYFEYDNDGNIKNTYRYNKGGGTHTGGPSYVPSNYELDVAYLTDLGKPTQVKGQDGVVTSYIWGYNKQYPVAKIVNATYSQATASGLGLDFGKIDAPGSAQEILDEIDKVRVGLPNAQVTTYTYKPLIGVNAIVDPKGYKMTYYYDGFGRLQYVKDQDGNVLSKNEYHYKN